MKRENLFSKKFKLLNSQEEYNNISWSSSESSDYENTSSNWFHCNRTHNRKRKRKKNNSKNHLNISFTNIPEPKTKENNGKSPVLNLGLAPSLSPILTSPRQNTSLKCVASPILQLNQSYKRKENHDVKGKSPVLVLKKESSWHSSSVKKKLFAFEKCSNSALSSNLNDIESNKNFNPYETSKNYCDSRSKVSYDYRNQSTIKCNNNCDTSLLKDNCPDCELNRTTVKEEANRLRIITSNEEPSDLNLENAFLTKHSISKSSKPKSRLDVLKNVQSFFNSHFSSESTSQQTISECETSTSQNTSKSSEDIDIVSSITQAIDPTSSAQELNTLANSDGNETNIILDMSKKVKYKKNGLASRLNVLVKKQNAYISLWQHEKFLANNSDFVVPKSEYIVFRIQKVHFKYGSYLLESLDLHDKKYLIFINGCYVNSNSNIASNVMLKLYKPYKILDLFNDCEVITNVYKFECVPIIL